MMRSFCLLLWSLSVFLVESNHNDGTRRATWMSGRWGIGYRIHANAPSWNTYDVQAFIDQLRTIKGDPGWIILNLSGPAHGGDIYLSHHPLLWSLGNTDATPEPGGRDLFKELLDAIHGEGLKVIAYMAGQGPGLLKIQNNANRGHRLGFKPAHDYNTTTERSPSLDRWRAYVTEAYGDPDEDDWQNCKTAYVEQIVSYYANKYGTDIDGWWFDQGRYIDRPLLEKTCREGNPNAVLAINNGQKVPLRVNNAPYEDFTFGHPNPITRTSPSDPKNLPMINSIESTSDGFMTQYNWDVLEHLFMPMGTTWNAIARSQTSLEWDESQALDWMSRALLSGGAWTWNIPRENYQPVSEMSVLRRDFVDFLNVVVDQLAPSSAPSLPPSSKPSQLPSASPSSVPSISASPSFQPSNRPSLQPSSQPSRSLTPSFSPSDEPSVSKVPSLHPSWAPSLSVVPSYVTSASPSDSPTVSPSVSTTNSPSFEPLSHSVCQTFAVHAGAALTFAANTIKSGNVGAGAAITGISNLLDGEIVNDSSAFAAETVELHTALMAVRAGEIPISGNIGGRAFKPGTYRSDAAITISSNVVLDGDGDDNSVFLFHALSMATAASTSIVLTNGAKAKNVLWVFKAASAHGATSVFEGSIVAGGAVTFGAGCALHGCVLSLAAITFGAGGSVDTKHDIDGETGIIFLRDGDGSTGRLRGWKR